MGGAVTHAIVWPDEHTGPVFVYDRLNNRPDFPSVAILILDTVPYPTPQERRMTMLAAKLPDDVADHWDFQLVETRPGL